MFYACPAIISNAFWKIAINAFLRASSGEALTTVQTGQVSLVHVLIRSGGLARFGGAGM